VAQAHQDHAVVVEDEGSRHLVLGVALGVAIDRHLSPTIGNGHLDQGPGSASSAGLAACWSWVRWKFSLPAIHLPGAFSPKTMASKDSPAVCIVSTLPPCCVKLETYTHATRVLSVMGPGQEALDGSAAGVWMGEVASGRARRMG